MNEWERCEGWLEAALEKSGATHTTDDILEALAEGKVQLWAGDRCAVVTEILQYPQTKRVRVWLAGGDLDEIAAMLEAGQEWARDIGADAIEVVGRKGWARVLENDGFTEEARHLVKEL